MLRAGHLGSGTLGITVSQQLTALVASVQSHERDVRVLSDIVMGIAAEHPDECECQACAWADKYPEWLARLRRERSTR